MAARKVKPGLSTVRDIIGADRLIYQDLHGLIRSVRHTNSTISEFDTSCFSGEYVTGDVTDEYLVKLEARRNDAAKEAQKSGPSREPSAVAV